MITGLMVLVNPISLASDLALLMVFNSCLVHDLDDDFCFALLLLQLDFFPLLVGLCVAFGSITL